MTHPTVRALVICLLLAAAAACGKKGNPLPPLRPVPARIADLTAVRTAGQVELRFTVPAANLDGSAPVVIERVDIYGMQASEGQTVPPAGQLSGNPRNLIESLPVRRPLATENSPGATPVSTLVPLPGEIAVYVHRTDAAEKAGADSMYYVAVPVAGTGNGRRGPPTPVANVPLGALPAPPADVVFSLEETAVRVTWVAAAANHAFRVVRLTGESGPPEVLSPEPVAVNEFRLPAVFGREVCVAVQSLVVTGPVVVAGPLSDRACVTPMDRFPPPVPTGLRVVQDGPAVRLIWDAVEAPDLAGYIVLRGDGSAVSLQPLFREPIKETTYRDTTAVPGARYDYAVYSVDTSSAANVSALSARETITVR